MTEQYEMALAKYYNKLRLVPVPLVSWDIFAGHDSDLNSYNSFQKHWKDKESLSQIVYQAKKAIIITNANQEIVFATQGIYKMNGYHPFEIIGKSPKIFQGKLTTEASRNKIRAAIKSQLPFKEIVVNYKKDGSTYLCEIEAYPKFNKKGELINYIAIEKIAS